MNSRLASRRLSSEKSSVLTKEALQDLNLQDFDVMEGWEPTPGKIYTKVRAISARINQNYDAWPSDELKKSYRTFLGKPVFVNHVNDDPRKARGVVVAARFVENSDDKYVEVIQEVDADRFPILAHELVTGGLDSVSMGAEARICKCSYCGNEANDMLTMCSHVLGQKGQILGKVNEDGTREDILVYEECRDISFFELSYVFDPADETAVVSNVLTANKKRGYGETALPPQVDTLRDEEEDLGSYFIEPPEEFQEPDLDKEYPDIDRGESSPDRRGEEQREDYDMARVSRRSRRGRNLSRRRHAREYTPEDWEALEWDNQYVPFAVGEEMHGDDFAFAPPGTAIGAEAEDGSGETYEIVKGRDGGWYNNDYKVDLHWEEVGSGVVSRSPKTSNRRSRNMSRNNRMSRRRRHAGGYGRNLPPKRTAREYTEEEWQALEWEDAWIPFEVGVEMQGDDFAFAPPGTAIEAEAEDGSGATYEIFKGRDGTWGNDDYKVDVNWDEMGWGVVSRAPKMSSRRGKNMNGRDRFRSSRRRYAEEYGRNDQGEQEEVYISQTPPAEPLETGAGASDAPNNSQGDRVKTDRNRSTHTNFEARRRRSNRRHALDKNFYEEFLNFAEQQGIDFNEVENMNEDEMYRFDEAMYDFLDVNSVDDDDRIYDLMDASSSFGAYSPGGNDHLHGPFEDVPVTPPSDEDYARSRAGYPKNSRRRRSNRRRANGLRMIDDMQLLETYAGSMAEFEDGRGGVGEQDIAEIEEELDRRGIDPFDNDIYSNRRRRSRRRMAAFDPNISDDDLLGGAQIAEVLQNAYPDDLESRDKFQELIDEANNRGLDYEQWKSRHARRRMAEQSDDFNLNSRADIARNVEDEDLFEAPVETQPKDASRKRRRARRRVASPNLYNEFLDYAEGQGMDLGHMSEMYDRNYQSNGMDDEADRAVYELESLMSDYAGGDEDAFYQLLDAPGSYGFDRVSNRKRRRARRRRHANPHRMITDDVADIMGISVPFKDGWEVINNPNMPAPTLFKEISDFDGLSVTPSGDGSFSWSVSRGLKNDGSGTASSAEEAMAMAEQAYGQRTSSRRRRRRMADTNLDLAAPDGRVNVEAPVSGVTDEDAQASQFDKGDYGHNAGDGLADPDLSTDQNWAPGEGKTSTRKASQIEGMRLAEAMVEAGLEKHDDRWKLAESYTKLPAAIVRDRISLLSRTASVKTPSRDDNGQRPMKSARKSPGLGNGPSLRKVADNKTDDYSLYF